jgi:catechol 2,3-dioxygenase-like lactoylglutathione lyase family enzyme
MMLLDGAMDIVGLGWLGTRTPHAGEMADFYREVLGLRPTHEEPGFWVFTLPDGCHVELFDEHHKPHFTTGPVGGFAVRDLAAAVAELRAAGIEVLDDSGPTWQHFRAPDGNVYELVQAQGHVQ